MQLSPQELEAVSANQMGVMRACLQAIFDRGEQAQLTPLLDVLSTTDGLIAAAALIAESSGMFRSQKERRAFAENCRTAMLKSMKEARAEADACMAEMAN